MCVPALVWQKHGEVHGAAKFVDWESLYAPHLLSHGKKVYRCSSYQKVKVCVVAWEPYLVAVWSRLKEAL